MGYNRPLRLSVWAVPDVVIVLVVDYLYLLTRRHSSSYSLIPLHRSSSPFEAQPSAIFTLILSLLKLRLALFFSSGTFILDKFDPAGHLFAGRWGIDK